MTTVDAVVSQFGASAKLKLSNPGAIGSPEDQLRAPFEQLLSDLAALGNFASAKVVAVGETSLSDLKIRPDYSVTVHSALVGFVELKAPGKGADPRRFKDKHDKEQWEKLKQLPNLIYTDGNSFSLWRDGELVGSIVHLYGDIESAGIALKGNMDLLSVFNDFLHWQPTPPRSVKELAMMSARLCRLLRDEVEEQLERDSPEFKNFASDWRMMLFPEATDQRFADGYAQAVTFGFLMARAQNVSLQGGVAPVISALKASGSLIGSAIQLLVDDSSKNAIKTSLATLSRVLEVVDWPKLSKGKSDAWLYFYEDFLEVYDNKLRKLTGSYYTPPEVVSAMVRWTDEVLRGPAHHLPQGLASPKVWLVDPATGTGTYLLGVLRHIAEQVKADQGEGAVAGYIHAALERIAGFEIQLGPYAVAQLRMLAEVVELTGAAPEKSPNLFVTDTLGNPYDDGGKMAQIFAPIAESRKAANKIKRDTPVTVILGNPPYKEKAMGKGGWVETGDPARHIDPLLDVWQPPKELKAGAHAKHLRNLYVFFWRWASWKIWDHGPGDKTGIVCFITVSGFLNGPGFQQMRAWLRDTCDDLWVVDCSPEGHQPEVPTRIFQGVQQPVCIVLASRSSKTAKATPARVRFRALPEGHRSLKYDAMKGIDLFGDGWTDCPTDRYAPFLPASTGAWAKFPELESLFTYDGSGVMPGRTWVIAPDAGSLLERWSRLVTATPGVDQERFFHPHLQGDKHVNKKATTSLHGHEERLLAVSADKGVSITPTRYGFRSFDRQWIIPDTRLINRPNPKLWELQSDKQIFFTAVTRKTIRNGPALTITGVVPDLDHYSGRGGRVLPLWSNADASQSNLSPKLADALSKRYGKPVAAEDVFSYIAGIAAHPAYTAKFQMDLSKPGLRIPLTADADSFAAVASAGRRVIWLHTYGERMADAGQGRPQGAPRAHAGSRPTVPKDGAIPHHAALPEELSYDAEKLRLHLGDGYIDHVAPKVWAYEVDRKQVILQWFSYRKRDRSKPTMGDKRPPSPLQTIQPDHWLAEYTTDLLDLLNVLTLLVDLEPEQAKLLDRVCGGPLISEAELQAEGALGTSPVADALGESQVEVQQGLF
ncbi:type ISP restriction/modification enzyme [Luteimonas sp. MC1828]|uniref:type ISP restriction/modification enzyme n=1 Tax=Luteimonas sp. MC1828 TaxID=2799787 RepID=UPI0018F18F27|nr:type ISP restriction/modification enzyme [Luteimonas sp. MC1828]MBJ7575669.1 N-6 DNA methylase [Luteimonas sp. MC1828]